MKAFLSLLLSAVITINSAILWAHEGPGEEARILADELRHVMNDLRNSSGKKDLEALKANALKLKNSLQSEGFHYENVQLGDIMQVWKEQDLLNLTQTSAIQELEKEGTLASLKQNVISGDLKAAKPQLEALALVLEVEGSGFGDMFRMMGLTLALAFGLMLLSIILLVA